MKLKKLHNTAFRKRKANTFTHFETHLKVVRHPTCLNDWQKVTGMNKFL